MPRLSERTDRRRDGARASAVLGWLLILLAMVSCCSLAHRPPARPLPQQLLGAVYEGAVVTMLRALDELLRACGLDPADPEVAARPLHLIGGGAQGRTWVETVRRLSGRPVIVPGSGELVALGAAALAAAAACGEDPAAIATGWNAGG